MLSRELLRNEPDRVRAGLAARGAGVEGFERWLHLDEERRRHIVEVEELKRRRNEASKAIGRIKREGGDAAAEIAAVGELKARIEELEGRLGGLGEEADDLERGFPNLPHDSVPRGADETANRVEKEVGERRDFAAEGFAPQAHWDLGPALGILDFERGAKVTGARFTAYFGAGARLERALIQLMLDLHGERHGYVEVLPPFIVNAESMFGTGQLPKFAADSFKLEGYDWYLAPTAEVPVTNLHRDEVLEEAALPVRYCAYTPCFRSEAGSYGKDVRGLIRQHQFNKVELVHFVHPERSWEALEELTGHAEAVLELLGLPYRRVTLSTGDVGFGSAKTYDLEVWLPGQSAYREISSCTNFLDFQARRANLRYRDAESGKPRHLHTLNGSALAVGRTLVAVLENYQQADGSVDVPEPLRRYLGGQERIAAPAG
jgi:seryl-tRNA synthetase